MLPVIPLAPEQLNANRPIATLLSPVVFLPNASNPIAILLLPEVNAFIVL